MEIITNHALFCIFMLLIILMNLLSPTLAWKCKYEVEVRTGSRFSADTKAKVSLKLCDTSNNCPVNSTNLAKMGTSTKGENDTYFQRSGHDKFEFEVEEECIQSCKMILSQDNTGPNPSWFVEVVIVRVYTPNEEVLAEDFEVHRWLSKFKPPKSLRAVVDNCNGAVTSTVTTP